MHSVPLPINVRCNSNSDIIVRRREVTLRAIFGLMHRNMIGEKLTRRRLDGLCSPIDLHPQFQRLESFFACPREVCRMIYAHS